jgi:hypothetical protein
MDTRSTLNQGYDINGYTFYTKQQDKKSTYQNSGVHGCLWCYELRQKHVLWSNTRDLGAGLSRFQDSPFLLQLGWCNQGCCIRQV